MLNVRKLLDAKGIFNSGKSLVQHSVNSPYKNGVVFSCQLSRMSSSASSFVLLHNNKQRPVHEHTPSASFIIQQNRWYSASPSSKSDELIDTSKLDRVYYGSLGSKMRMVKVFSLTTSLVGLAAQPILMEQGMKLGGVGMAVGICVFSGFFAFVTPLMLHFITKKYVTEIHYNAATDEYTASTISLFLQKIQTTFKTSDVVVPDVPGLFTSFVVKKRPLFVDPALFDDPEHYVRMMGYDKPVDFKLNRNETEPTQNKEQPAKK